MVLLKASTKYCGDFLNFISKSISISGQPTYQMKSDIPNDHGSISRDSDTEKERKDYRREMCLEQIGHERPGDPDFNHIEEQIYATPESAYGAKIDDELFLRPSKSSRSSKKSPKMAILEDLRKVLDRKIWKNHLPNFEGIGQMLLDSSKKKTHLLYYVKYKSSCLPTFPEEVRTYKSLSGQTSEDLFRKIKINDKTFLNRNIHVDLRPFVN